MITGFTMADAVTPLEKELEAHLRRIIYQRDMLTAALTSQWESCGVPLQTAHRLVQQVLDRAAEASTKEYAP